MRKPAQRHAQTGEFRQIVIDVQDGVALLISRCAGVHRGTSRFGILTYIILGKRYFIACMNAMQGVFVDALTRVIEAGGGGSLS